MKTNLVAKVVVTLLTSSSLVAFAAPGTGNHTGKSNVPNGGTIKNSLYPDDVTLDKYSYAPGNGNNPGKWINDGTGQNAMGPGDGYDVRPGKGANQAKPQNKAHGKSPCFETSLEGGCAAKSDDGDDGGGKPDPKNVDVFQIYETMVKGPNASQTGSSKECADGSEACHESGDNADNRLSFMDISGVAPAGADGVIGGLPPGQAMRTTIYTISGGVNTTVPGVGLGLGK